MKKYNIHAISSSEDTDGGSGDEVSIRIPKFKLKTRDFVPVPKKREHLYGRQEQLSTLVNALEKSAVKSQVVFISGMPGAGKVCYSVL